MNTSSEKTVENDDRLLIEYTISHQGKELESSSQNEAQEYQMGEGQWPVQLELMLLGEKPGARLNIELQAAQMAFGVADPERIVTMNLQDFDVEPDPGELIEFTLDNGEHVEGQVLSIFADNVEVDFNHPYAGRDLTFNIHIISIL